MLCVSELATNAVLHSASRNPGGTFTVRAAIFDDHVRIEVEDNGGTWDEHPHSDVTLRHGPAWTSSANCAADCGRDGSPLTGWVAWARLGMALNVTTMTDPNAAPACAQRSQRWVTVLDGTQLGQ